MTYVAGEEPSGPCEVTVKVRYKSLEVPAVLHPDGRRARIEFREPQRALTPGQAAVVYRGDELIGGGVIERVARPRHVGVAGAR
jgi:tRNA-specific 2-thiouridylase